MLILKKLKKKTKHSTHKYKKYTPEIYILHTSNTMEFSIYRWPVGAEVVVPLCTVQSGQTNRLKTMTDIQHELRKQLEAPPEWRLPLEPDTGGGY